MTGPPKRERRPGAGAELRSSLGGDDGGVEQGNAGPLKPEAPDDVAAARFVDDLVKVAATATEHEVEEWTSFCSEHEGPPLLSAPLARTWRALVALNPELTAKLFPDEADAVAAALQGMEA